MLVDLANCTIFRLPLKSDRIHLFKLKFINQNKKRKSTLVSLGVSTRRCPAIRTEEAGVTEAPDLGRPDGLRVDVLQVVVAQSGNCVTGRDAEGSGSRVVAWNSASDDGPQQHRAQTEKCASQQAKRKQTNSLISADTRFAPCSNAPVSNPLLGVDGLQMGTAVNVQRCSNQRVKQQEVGHVFLRDQPGKCGHGSGCGGLLNRPEEKQLSLFTRR